MQKILVSQEEKKFVHHSSHATMIALKTISCIKMNKRDTLCFKRRTFQFNTKRIALLEKHVLFIFLNILQHNVLHAAFPWLKIIMLIREPAARYLSNFNHALKRRKIDVKAGANVTRLFEGIVQNEIRTYENDECTEDAKFGGPFQKHAQHNCLSLKRGFYVEHIKRYERYFGGNNIKVVLHDDLREAKSIQSILFWSQ